MRLVRSSIGNLLASAGVAEVSLRGLMEGLALRRSLAYRVVKLVQAEDPLEAAEHVPGPKGIALLLVAAEERGAEPALVDQVRTAMARFETLVSEHAGTRPALRSLAGALSPTGRARTALLHRRRAVEANRHIWGVHVAVQYHAAFAFRRVPGWRGWPEQEHERADVAIIRGFEGMTRSRQDVAWECMRVFLGENATTPMPTRPRVVPLAPEDLLGEIPILRKYSTAPLPRIERKQLAPHEVSYEVRPEPIGQKGAATLRMGEVYADSSRLRSEPGVDRFRLVTGFRTPCDVAVVELYLDRELYPSANVEAHVWDMLRVNTHLPPGAHPPPPPPRMDLDLVVENRGSAASTTPIFEVNRHAALVADVFERIGRSPSDFDTWAVRVKFPPMPTTLVLEVPLLHAP